MSKVTPIPVTSVFNTQAINENNRKFAEALNEGVLWRKNPQGEPNEMNNDIDMNSKRVYNLPAPILEHEAARKGDMDNMIAEANSILTKTEAQRMLAELAKREAQIAAANAKNSEVATNKNIEVSVAILQAAAKNSFYHYKSKADAVAANVPENAFVQVFKDESMDNSNIIYKKVGGVLVFQADLDILRKELSDSSLGSKLVAHGARTVHEELNDVSNVRRFITTPVDGVTSNQEGVNAAVQEAKILGQPLYWPRGTYNCPDNIPDFWEVSHYGPGVISRAGSVFFITPKKLLRNTIHVAPDGDALNDGLNKNTPTTVKKAFGAVRQIGEKALNGIWRIEFSEGEFTDPGLRTGGLPVFRNRLEIFGQSDSLLVEPKTVWKNTTTDAYALRMDHSIGDNLTSSSLLLHFRNLKFTGWTLGGGIESTGRHDVLAENIDVDGAINGLYFKEGFSRILYGRISNCSSHGIKTQMGIANVGNLGIPGSGVTFTDCLYGVEGGRLNNLYVHNSKFVRMRGGAINYNWLTRLETGANDYREIGTPQFGIIVGSPGAVWTDEEVGQSSLYPTLSINLPVMSQGISGGAINTNIQRMAPVTGCNVSGSLITISGRNGEAVLLSSVNNDPSWVPFRVPAWLLYGSGVSLVVEVSVTQAAGAGGVLALHGDGPGESSKIASITIPPHTSGRGGRIKMRFYQHSTGATGRQYVEYLPAAIYLDSASGNLNNSSIRQNVSDERIFRLYFTPSSDAQMQFYGMRTYVEM